MPNDHDQIDELTVGGVLDSLGDAMVADPWAPVMKQRRVKRSLVVADLDLDISDAPEIPEAREGKPDNGFNPSHDYAYYVGNLVDQVASQVLMLRTSLEPWMQQGPMGMQVLLSVTKRLKTLGTPLILELPISGTVRQRERQMNLLYGTPVRNTNNRVGFHWVRPTWIQIPGCADQLDMQSLVNHGHGVLLDLSWVHATVDAFALIRGAVEHPMAPRPASGVLPIGFTMHAGTFILAAQHLHDVIRAHTASPRPNPVSIPFLVETDDADTARAAIAHGARINCPVMVAPGRKWATEWQRRPEGATHWRRIALDYILNLNTALEKAP